MRMRGEKILRRLQEAEYGIKKEEVKREKKSKKVKKEKKEKKKKKKHKKEKKVKRERKDSGEWETQEATRYDSSKSKKSAGDYYGKSGDYSYSRKHNPNSRFHSNIHNSNANSSRRPELNSDRRRNNPYYNQEEEDK